MAKGREPNAVAVIPAAGMGVRMGGDLPKVLIPLVDRPLLAHTLLAFERAKRIDRVIVVVAEELLETVAHDVVDAHRLRKVSQILPGGATRQESVYAGLEAAGPSCDVVAIHDGARPLILPDIIDQAVEGVAQLGAAALAVRPKDTIRRGDEEVFAVTLDRAKLWQMQTPQVFSFQLIHWAYQKALEKGYRGTDDVSLVEVLGHKVHVVEGQYDNIKITTPEDVIFAELVLRRRESH